VGAGLVQVRRLLEAVQRVSFWNETGGIAYLAAAEDARHELNAPILARNLYLEYVRAEPEAIWAPKAILAALELTSAAAASDSGPEADELRRRLVEDYRHTAYVEALLGGDSAEFTFEQVEQGLRRQLDRMRNLADQQLTGGRRTGSRNP
jgi:hypothetical protein